MRKIVLGMIMGASVLVAGQALAMEKASLVKTPAAPPAQNQAHAGHGMTVAHQAAYSDKAFLSGMIAHHEGAIAMVDEVLKAKDLDPQVKAWAESIKAEQNKEIALMKGCLGKMGLGMDDAAYKSMQHDMQAMLAAQRAVKNPAEGFVREMTPHHAGAITMALPALLHTQSPEIRKLTEDIIESQTKEIAAFREWMSVHGQK